ncbi:MAG: inorganic phosphate transporter [Deltaproteobacteria bacterium]|nr:inorganic phosphate transporter [Deltaproteobacteria bacterium]
MSLLFSGLDTLILAFATLVGFYMATNIGANDLANAMGTSVGSGALTLKGAVVASVIFNLAGAILAGGHVTNTIRKGMIDPSLLAGSPEKLLLGMFAALLAAAVWVHVATHLGLPVSTTHSIVGAVVGFGVLAVGFDAVSWKKVIIVVLSWITSPLAGGVVSGAIYYLIQKKILDSRSPYQSAKLSAPWLLSLVWLVILLSVLSGGVKGLRLGWTFGTALLIAIPAAAAAGFGARAVLSRLGGEGCRWIYGDEQGRVECIFGYLQVMTACYVAFAHGSNDVANAVGPMAAIYSVVQTKTVATEVEVPLWMLGLGGAAIGGGLLAFGSRVMQTIGKNITEITRVRGFCAEFGAATTILVCSRIGLPVSTTHVLVGSVIGIGFMRGMGFLDLRVIRNIASSWLVTLPFTVVLSMILYGLFVSLLT